MIRSSWSEPPRPGPTGTAARTPWPSGWASSALPWTTACWRREGPAGRSLGRPHLATAVVTHPANAQRLEQAGLQTIEKFIPAYLIRGTPAYMPRTSPTVQEAIGWIHDAGGVAIWAHPFWMSATTRPSWPASTASRAWGLDGVECFYPTYTAEQTLLLTGHCRESDLLTTGSSDYHGPTHKLFSRFLAHETLRPGAAPGPHRGLVTARARIGPPTA